MNPQINTIIEPTIQNYIKNKFNKFIFSINYSVS